MMTGCRTSTEAAAAASLLRIDLDAVAANYQLLSRRLGTAACGAAVKADAYGIGASRVARRLVRAGCRVFFVATLDEAVALRADVPDTGVDIAVLCGVLPGTEPVLAEHRLIPVINDPGQIARWRRAGERAGVPLDAMLHVDTGMNRLGLSPRETDRLAGAPELLAGVNWRYLVSHLACADDPDDPENTIQLDRIRAVRARLPAMPVSLANSAGILLGPDWHFDLVRPGIALYGGAPQPGRENPMHRVVALLGRVLQVRDIEPGMRVGYGGDYRACAPGRIATVAAGYADGYLRSSAGRARVHLGRIALPVVGRVSMDLITVDVTEAPEAAVFPGALVELLGGRNTVDDAAAAAGTIAYEILTSLGRRYHREYLEDAAEGQP